MKRLKYIFTIFLLLAFFGSKAQEELKPLKYNTVLFDQFSTLQSQQLAADRENVRVGSFVYKIDTMPIPFIDDFSTNRIKQYTAQEGDINIVLDVRTTFSANGLTPEELELVFYQTFDYTCLLYTSDAADDMQCVDLGGRRIIKKMKKVI